MEIFDTHAHVNFNAFKYDSLEVLKRCQKDEILVVNVGSQYSTSMRAVEYAHKFKNGIYAAIGIHPMHLKKGSFIHQDPSELTEEEIPTTGEQYDFEKYLKLAQDKKVVAIGEIGLDYHHFEQGDDIEMLKELQKETLISFIDLANYVDKPVMIHCWDAYDDLLQILTQHPVNKKGIIHSFIGSYKTANKFIDLGYVLGLNGIVTYGDSYDRLIKEIDLAHVVLETDCPYLTPRPLEKGTRNEPLYVVHVAAKIAEVKKWPAQVIAEITTENAKRILRIE